MRWGNPPVADGSATQLHHERRVFWSGVLAGAMVVLAAAAWAGVRFEAELTSRDALIARLEAASRPTHGRKIARVEVGPPAGPPLTAVAVGSTEQGVGSLGPADGQPGGAASAAASQNPDLAAIPPIPAPTAAGPSPEVAQLRAALDLTMADRVAAKEQVRVLSANTVDLADTLNAVTSELLATRSRFRSWVQKHYDELRGVLKTSGIHVDPLVKLAEAKLAGEGGPFVAPPKVARRGHNATLVPLPPGLRADFQAVDIMSVLLAALPLGIPAPGAETHSGFGIRHDPFTRRPAMHTGLDFSPGPLGRAYATAPGVVVLAGREGAYGKMVEIKHSFGLSTRYAHLARVEVEVGQQVAQGTELGMIGSTGRSTGRHLHYEVRIDGTAVDPADFLEARMRLAHVVSQE